MLGLSGASRPAAGTGLSAASPRPGQPCGPAGLRAFRFDPSPVGGVGICRRRADETVIANRSEPAPRCRSVRPGCPLAVVVAIFFACEEAGPPEPPAYVGTSTDATRADWSLTLDESGFLWAEQPGSNFTEIHGTLSESNGVLALSVSGIRVDTVEPQMPTHYRLFVVAPAVKDDVAWTSTFLKPIASQIERTRRLACPG